MGGLDGKILRLAIDCAAKQALFAMGFGAQNGARLDVLMVTMKNCGRTLARVWLALAVVTLAGCETAGKLSEGVGNMADKALETIGFKKPELPPMPEIPESAKPPRQMKMLIAASDSLNLNASGRSLSLVVRVYKLRSTTAFLSAPYETFGNTAKEKEVLSDELIEVKELVLLPGQRRQINERWAREAPYVGVVGLFIDPAPQRWRYAFELETFQFDEGFVLGAHSCTLSVASGNPVGISQAALKLQSSVCGLNSSQAEAGPMSNSGR
jgi:type VI secretion system protein VasD